MSKHAVESTSLDTTLGERISSMLAALLAGLTTLPVIQGPGADREFYRYVGMLWAKGGLPYRDVFDIKPPVIFLAAWGGSPWLLWLVINATMAVAAMMLCGTFKRLRISQPVAFTVLTLVVLRMPSIVEGGGLSYELSAALCAIAVSLAVREDPSGLRLGAVTALVALTQQTDLVGLGPFLVAALYRSPAHRGMLVRMFVGAAWILGPALLYFLSNDALNVWLLDTWTFPLRHFSGQALALPERVGNLGRALWATRLLPLVVWALLLHGWESLAGRRDEGHQDDLAYHFGDVLGVALVLQTVAVCVSGKFYGHYFLTFSVYLVLFAGLAWRIGERFLPSLHSRKTVASLLGIALILSPEAIFMSPLLRHKAHDLLLDTQRTLSAWRVGSTPYAQAMARDRITLRDVRGHDGQMFVFRGYGRPMALYADLQVRAPTRFVHQLFWDGSARGAVELGVVLDDLEAAKTRYILDYSEYKPLRDEILQRRWESWRDRHYSAGIGLECDLGVLLCGRLYTRRK